MGFSAEPEGAGTIVKSGGKMYWGCKASMLRFPRQGDTPGCTSDKGYGDP